MTKEEILELIEKYKKNHADYKKAFLDDGKIDPIEQQQLDKVETKIKDLEKLLGVVNDEPVSDKSVKNADIITEENELKDWKTLAEAWLNDTKDWVGKEINAANLIFTQPLKLNNPSPASLLSGNKPEPVKYNRFKSVITALKKNVPETQMYSDLLLEEFIQNWAKNNKLPILPTFEETTIALENERIKWTEPTEVWLQKNGIYAQMRLDTTITSGGDLKSYQQSLKKHVKRIKAEVKEAEQVSDSQIETFLKDWLINNKDQFFKLFFKNNEDVLKLQAVDNIFSELKLIGAFDWNFSGGKLYLKAGGKALNVTAASGFEIDSDGNLVPKVGGDLKTDIKITDNVSANVKLGAEHKEGYTKGKIEVGTKIKAPILIGDVELKFNIDTKKTWGFQLAFASKGGGHLSKKVVELTNNTMISAAKAMDEIYSGELSEAEIDDRLNKINADIDKLNKVLQEPIDKKENIAFTFGVSGDKYGNVSFGAGIIIRF